MTKNQNPTANALLYVRVSTGRQAEEGVSLEHQESELIQKAESLGFGDWEMIREEGKSGKNLTGRPALTEALEQLNAGEAQALIVHKLDRLSRSIKDVGAISENSRKYGWRMVIMDLNVDTDTAIGDFMLNLMASFAQMERWRIGERQADVHASRRQTGQVWGVTCGPRTPEAVRTRVLALRANGMTVRAIAQELEAEGIPTARGGNWQASTVAKILKAKAAQPAA